MEGGFFLLEKRHKCAPFWCMYFSFSLTKILVGDKDKEGE